MRAGPLYSYTSVLNPFIADPERTLGAPVDSGRFLPHVDLLQWKIPVTWAVHTQENVVVNRSADPGQTRNLWDDEPAARRLMLDLLRDVLATEGAPPEQHERLGWPA